MSEATLAYRWTRDEFVRAWEAGVFDRRVELIDGEVWPVVIGPWHGFATGRLAGILHALGSPVTMATLPSQDSLPDPDCWVCRDGAEPIEQIGARLVAWDPRDVLLVAEVSDESVVADLTTKARLYGAAGYAVYWVVTRDVVYEHTGPHADGYRTRTEYRRGDRIPVAYAGAELDVTAILGD